MSNPVVRFDAVSKRYYLGKHRAFIRELLPDFLKPKHNNSQRSDELWALRDLSFTLHPGEALGIIGTNGSGKTTTLTLLAGITMPTTGSIETHGTIGALIQLGAGFHPELTGKENVYLNAAILGLRKSQVDEIYDRIVEFAEIAAFMDTPVKRYSSGMYARLGFSVAAHIHPQILLVDEVLAVGDMAFQSKCTRRMHELIDQGCAVVFVSHNLNLVQGLCNRVMWIDKGRCVKMGPPVETIAAYSEEIDRRLHQASFEDIRNQGTGTGDIRVNQVILRDQSGVEASEFRSGESMTVELHYQTEKRIEKPYFWIGISSKYGGLFSANMLLDGFRPESIEGSGIIRCTFPSLPLMPQSYGVAIGIRSSDGATLLIQSRYAANFRITGNSRDLGFESDVAESMSREIPPVLVPYEWRFPDGQIHVVNSKEKVVAKK